MTDTSCSAERPPNSNATRSLSAMSWSPESARWQGTSPKAAGLVNRVDARARAKQSVGASKGATPSAVRSRDCARRHRPRTGRYGLDPLDGLRYTELKRTAIGKITYVKRV